MVSEDVLRKAVADAADVVKFKGGFDTFAFRKHFEKELPKKDQQMILAFVKDNLAKGTPIYEAVKEQIDHQEFLATDYYANPYPRKFYGAYAPVVYKTFAGLVAVSM